MITAADWSVSAARTGVDVDAIIIADNNTADTLLILVKNFIKMITSFLYFLQLGMSDILIIALCIISASPECRMVVI